MTWNATFPVSLLDLLIVAGITWVFVASTRARRRIRIAKTRTGFAGVVFGLVVIGFFHVADLLMRHVLPGIVSTDRAMSVAAGLIVDYRWPATVLGMGAIALGYVLTTRETVALVEDLRRAEAALAEREQQLMALFDNSPALIYMKDVQSRVIRVNKRYAEAFGIDQDAAVGDDGTSWLGPEKARQFAEHDQEIVRSKTPSEQEYDLDDADGRPHRMLIVKFPVFDEHGDVVAIGGITSDVTDRYMAEQEVRTSEERYRQVVDLMEDSIYVVQDERIVFANLGAAKLFGAAEPEQLIGVDSLTLVHPDHRETVRHRRRLATAGRNKTERSERQLLRLDGTAFDSESYAGPFDWDGRPAALVVIRDITNRKKAERALRLSQFTLDRSADSIFWITPDGRFIDVNEAACRALGYTRDELLAKSVADINPDYDPARWPDHWRKVRSNGAFIFEARHRAKDGRIIPVEISVNHVEFEGKEYNCSIARDITERRLTEEAVRKSEEQIRLITDTIPGLIAYIDVRRRIRFANKAYVDRLGRRRRDIIGKHLKEVRGETEYLADLPYLKKVLSGHEVTYEAELQFGQAEKRHSLSQLIPHYGEDGEVIGSFALLTDITAQKQPPSHIMYTSGKA